MIPWNESASKYGKVLNSISPKSEQDFQLGLPLSGMLLLEGSKCLFGVTFLHLVRRKSLFVRNRSTLFWKAGCMISWTSFNQEKEGLNDFKKLVIM